jgi:hypothetical protein
MPRPSRLSPEVRERAVRMVVEHQAAHDPLLRGAVQDVEVPARLPARFGAIQDARAHCQGLTLDTQPILRRAASTRRARVLGQALTPR